MSNFKLKASRAINGFGLKLKEHSPELLLVAGIAGAVTSTVLACKATTKVQSIIDEKNKNLDEVETALKGKQYDYNEDDKQRDLVIIYTQTGVKLLKLYGPALLVGAGSLISILASHNIIKKRNAALVAAYTAVDTSFKKYRANVVDRFGEEVDKELRAGVKAQKIKSQNEKGEEKDKTVKVATLNPSEYSDYARFFDESSSQYHKDAEYNLMFIRRQQDYANEMLKSQGYVFLNDVYDLLGIPKTKAGQVVGWVYDKNNPIGDNYVDFGIYNCSKASKEFVNGYEKSILLDFNVDGTIVDKVFKRG